MTSKDWFGIGYVSIWVLVWGTVGSLIDLPLLNMEIYTAGSLGQAMTFILTALISVLVGVWLFPRLLGSTFVINALGLEVDEPK